MMAAGAGGANGAGIGQAGDPAMTIDTCGAQAIAFHVTQDPINSEECFPCLGTGSSEGAGTLGVLSFKPGQSEAAGGTFVTENFAPTLQAQNNGSTAVPAIMSSMSVRRLTPKECERLMGFPDDYTNIPGAKDGPRYRALGNSMAVPVMRWIGKRIQMVEDATAGEGRAR
jgi:DNA (cytosine-5)-methyltransferase 1